MIKVFYKFTILLVVLCTLFLFVSVNKIKAATTPHQFERLFYMSKLHLADGLQSLQKNAASIDVVAPQLYTVDPNLIATGSVPLAIQTIAQANGIKIMPLIANGGFSRSTIHNLLISNAAQNAVIAFLIGEAEAHRYVGWQFDFEAIPAADRDAYSAFVEKTAAALHARNLQFSVAVVARASDDATTSFYQNWSGAFDYARIANAADFISLMTYDDPASSGPTASVPYVQSVLTYALTKIPPSKISLGVPLYYWGWNATTQKRVRADGAYSRLQQVRARYGVIEGFNPVYQVPYLIYSLGKYIYTIWHEDAQSMQAKLNLMKADNLRGFSAWVLGVEDPSVWNAINASN